MAFYFHSGLTGDALHGAKVQYFDPSDPMPSPSYDGQLIVRGDFLYFAQLTGAPPALQWRQVRSGGSSIPQGTVQYQIGNGYPNPPVSAGRIYVNGNTDEVYFSTTTTWIKIGPKGGGGGGILAEPVKIGSGVCSAGLFNAISFTGFLPGVAYGFLIHGSAGQFGGDMLLQYASDEAGNRQSIFPIFEGWMEVTPSDIPLDKPYFQIVVIPQEQPVCFSYDHETRIFELLGVYS